MVIKFRVSLRISFIRMLSRAGPGQPGAVPGRPGPARGCFKLNK